MKIYSSKSSAAKKKTKHNHEPSAPEAAEHRHATEKRKTDFLEDSSGKDEGGLCV
jgi:hypothetical protein